VELMFTTHIGPVLAMAEPLSACSAAPIGLQPFRFLAIVGAELRTLRSATALFEKKEEKRAHFYRKDLTVPNPLQVISQEFAPQNIRTP
jgi:hypothetical protein